MNYKIKFSNRGEKDFALVKKSPLKKKAFEILQVLEVDPYKKPCEKLQGNLQGSFSKRLNLQHRIVYEVRESEKIVNITAMWTHYE
ncbi:MAG: Txe/YoeB family addiction module toxin [Firmicutes bacterium]|nr:Txe/YoeB family addiction module toxin [Bacillota bacterium]